MDEKVFTDPMNVYDTLTLEKLTDTFTQFADKYNIPVSSVTLEIDAYGDSVEAYLQGSREMTDEEIAEQEKDAQRARESMRENARRAINTWKNEFPELFPPFIEERP